MKFHLIFGLIWYQKCYWSLLSMKFPHFPSDLGLYQNLVAFTVLALVSSEVLLKASEITAPWSKLLKF